MPPRLKGDISHVVKAEIAAKTTLTNIDVVKADDQHVLIWEEYVQKPFINKDNSRADQGWNWIRLNRWFKPIAKAIRQKPEIYCICMNKKGRFIPLGMIFIANSYPALHDKKKKSTFIWYLATAPSEFLERFLNQQEIPKVGKITIDVGLTASFQNKNDGLLGLHADPKGGEKLMGFYNHCSLKQLNDSVSLPRGRKFGGNDGRYFYFDQESAFSFSRSLDHLR